MTAREKREIVEAVLTALQAQNEPIIETAKVARGKGITPKTEQPTGVVTVPFWKWDARKKDYVETGKSFLALALAKGVNKAAAFKTLMDKGANPTGGVMQYAGYYKAGGGEGRLSDMAASANAAGLKGKFWAAWPAR